MGSFCVIKGIWKQFEMRTPGNVGQTVQFNPEIINTDSLSLSKVLFLWTKLLQISHGAAKGCWKAVLPEVYVVTCQEGFVVRVFLILLKVSMFRDVIITSSSSQSSTINFELSVCLLLRVHLKAHQSLVCASEESFNHLPFL